MRLFVDCRRAVSDNWVRFAPWLAVRGRGRKVRELCASQDTFLVVVGVLSQWILEPFFSDVSEARRARAAEESQENRCLLASFGGGEHPDPPAHGAAPETRPSDGDPRSPALSAPGGSRCVHVGKAKTVRYLMRFRELWLLVVGPVVS